MTEQATDEVSASPEILVILGTDHHPLSRLIHWVETWFEHEHQTEFRVTVQHGYTPIPQNTQLEYADFLRHADMRSTLARARAVVCHGGPGTIFDCRAAGLVPVVVPRSATEGEHVDDHQQLFTARLAEAGLIDLATNQSAFNAALTRALGRSREPLEGIDHAALATAAEALGTHVETALTTADRGGAVSGALRRWRARRRT